MTSTNQKTQEKLQRIMNMVFVLSGLLCLLAAVGLLLKLDASVSNIPRLAVFVGLPAFIGLIFLNVLRLPNGVRVWLFIGLISISVPLYAFEAYLHYQYAHSADGNVEHVMAKTGKPFDRRTRAEVIRDMRREGQAAYPNNPDLFLSQPQEGSTEIWPLTNRSNARIVVCNESGAFFIPNSDQYGLTNANSVYKAEGTSIVLVGDSFTQGGCVEDNAAVQIAREYPRTFNFGFVGEGPGLQYAILKEYMGVTKPDYVFWLYFENDLSDLVDETRQAVFKKYIKDPNFTQNLVRRQDEVDTRIDGFMKGFEEKVSASSVTWKPWGLLDMVLLRQLRHRLNLNLTGVQLQGNDMEIIRTALPTFDKLIQRTRNMVRDSGGELVFVYLPSSIHFVEDGFAERQDYKLRDQVLEIVKKNDVPVLDVLPVFRKHRSPLDQFYWYLGSHYNEDGYTIVANEIKAFVKNSGSSKGSDK